MSDQELGPRERILSAALELFVNQGYFNTNVPDISKHSRCSVGSIYHHFLNKEEIASKLYEDAFGRFRKAVGEALSDDVDISHTVRTVVKSFLLFSESHPMLARYLWLARHNEFLTKQVSKPTVVGFDMLGRKLARVIKTAMRSGEIAPLKAEVIWSVVFGIPQSYVLDWLDGHSKIPPSEIVDELSEVAWQALRK